jgi:hypothetical protein
MSEIAELLEPLKAATTRFATLEERMRIVKLLAAAKVDERIILEVLKDAE